MIKRISLLVTAALLVATMAMAGLAGPAFAAADKDPNDGCTKHQGTWTCETVDEPGNSGGPNGNQEPAGGTTTTTDQTQGNLDNKSPAESQDLKDNECVGPPGRCK